LNESIIDNAYDAGLIGINTSITARNLLVSNCDKNIVLVKGGNYNFTHCTAAIFSNSFIQHKNQVLLVTNFLNQNNVIVTSPLNAVFRNCIFWGENNGLVPSEVVVLKQGNVNPNVIFDQVLWRVQNNPANSTISGAINNQNPGFDSVSTNERIFNFRLKDGSPAIDKGTLTATNLDLDGNPRPVRQPDLGAYEKQ
jgi:hypothetical protein